MIASLAGRRIDAVGAEPARFPAERAPDVEARIVAALREHRATVLVCSAACGSDLLALDAARAGGIRARIVLPYAADAFRRSSVVDRDAAAGAAFDRLTGEAAAHGDLRVLGLPVGDPQAYELTNEAILDEALVLAGRDPLHVVALAVWDGAIAGRTDHTAAFERAARARAIRVESIPILG